MRVRSLALVAVILAAGSPAAAQTPVEAARALVARYHSLFLLPTIRRELDTLAEIDPRFTSAAASCSESSTRPARR
jgi:hypothetical protein